MTERRKILLVDDSGTALMMEKMILGKEPYELVSATNGKEAVEVALRERPDLILMDVIMPEMTGFEACKELRRCDETRDTPIIMVTTRGEADNIELGFSAGCTDYITKPIDGVELLAKVRSCLDQVGVG